MIELEKNSLIKAGVQFGSSIKWKNPQMNNYIHNKYKGKYILDINQIFIGCQELQKHVAELISNNKKILFVSTKKQAQEIVKEQAKKCGMPYITSKWIGGTLTNFNEIKKRLKELQELNNFTQKDFFQRMNKKKQIEIEKKKNKLQKIYEGIVNLWKKPDALFIIGLNKEKTASKEALKAKIPIIAICNVNCNPNLVDLVVAGNDEHINSISFFANLMSDIIIENTSK